MENSNQTQPEQEQQMSEEQLKQILKKAEKINKDALKFVQPFLKKYEKELLGISIIPPTQKDQKEINLLFLLDDEKKENYAKTYHEVQVFLQKFCLETNYVPHIHTLLQLKQALFDDEKELTLKVTKATPIFQKNNVLNAFILSEAHKDLVIEKFEKYIVSYACVGSILRGDGNPKSDIDVFVIIDDTDVKKMTRAELQDKLRNIIYELSFKAQALTNIKISLHIQTYLLTDFWEMIKDISPVISTFLRDGIPFFDRGIYKPWKILQDMGRIKPSREAIAKHSEMGDLFYERAKKKLLSVVVEDLYYAVLNPAQALLMLKGVPPPTHKETITMFNEVIIEKEKLVSKKYLEILEEFVILFKKWEYNEVTEMTGDEAESFMKKADDFRKTIHPILDKLNYELYKTKLFDKKDKKSEDKDKSVKANLKNKSKESKKQTKKKK